MENQIEQYRGKFLYKGYGPSLIPLKIHGDPTEIFNNCLKQIKQFTTERNHSYYVSPSNRVGNLIDGYTECACVNVSNRIVGKRVDVLYSPIYYPDFIYIDTTRHRIEVDAYAPLEEFLGLIALSKSEKIVYLWLPYNTGIFSDLVIWSCFFQEHHISYFPLIETMLEKTPPDLVSSDCDTYSWYQRLTDYSDSFLEFQYISKAKLRGKKLIQTYFWT